MLWTIIIILLILWLLGAFGGRIIPDFPDTGGNWIHILIVIVVILIILHLLGIT